MSNDHVHPIFQPILAGIASKTAKVDPGYYCEHCTSPGECDIGGCGHDNAEADSEPSDPDGECLRGGEWAAAQAAEMDWVRRHLK